VSTRDTRQPPDLCFSAGDRLFAYRRWSSQAHHVGSDIGQVRQIAQQHAGDGSQAAVHTTATLGCNRVYADPSIKLHEPVSKQ
jgi:hypothetical protein